MPEYEVSWSFTETIEADDEKAALDLTRERIDRLLGPKKFGVKRSISGHVQPVTPDERGTDGRA